MKAAAHTCTRLAPAARALRPFWTPDFDAAHEHASPLAPNVGESGQTSHAIMQCHIAPRRAQRAEKLGGMWFVGRVGQGLRMEPGGEVTA